MFIQCIPTSKVSLAEIAKNRNVQEGVLVFHQNVIIGHCDSMYSKYYFIPNISQLLKKYPGKTCKSMDYVKECSGSVSAFFIQKNKRIYCRDNTTFGLAFRNLKSCKYYRDYIVPCTKMILIEDSVSSDMLEELERDKIPYFKSENYKTKERIIQVFYPVTE
jgi:hypothetical protein